MIKQITYNGLNVKFSSLTLSIGNDDAAWTGSFSVLYKYDYNRIKINSLIRIVIEDTMYSMVVDKKSFSKESVSTPKMTISVISPICLLSSPLGEKITKQWNGPRTGSAVIKELLPIAEIRMEDWTLDSDYLDVENEYKLDVAKKIAESVGGHIDSLPSGTIRIRKKYPYDIRRLQVTSLNRILHTDRHILAISSSVQIKNPLVTSVRFVTTKK